MDVAVQAAVCAMMNYHRLLCWMAAIKHIWTCVCFLVTFLQKATAQETQVFCFLLPLEWHCALLS